MATIHPTGHCFDDALEFLNLRVLEDRSLAHRDTLLLVHGIALGSNGPNEGKPYAHAWIEEDGLCWDAGILDGRQVYYAVGHYGPWRPEYRALCSTSKRVFGDIQATYKRQEA